MCDTVVHRLQWYRSEEETVKRGTNKVRSVLAALITICLPTAILASACADTNDGDVVTPAGGEGGGVGDDGPGICLMNNCSSDDQCGGCADKRNTCLVAENRCVACDPNTGQGCDAGEYCTSFGLCAPDGLTCPTDDRGVPQVTCTQNSDCLACSPMHQVCDTATGQCQACTATNTQHCLSSDICTDGECSPKCPSSCDADSDCGQCGSPGNEAHACNQHKCAECSPTYPCAAGLQCIKGACLPQCGIPGPTTGECLSHADCAACGDANNPSSHTCKKPINKNGPNDRGVCAPQATGCSDLGSSVAVLPEPWSSVTNLCSSDNDCAGQGITFNVGEAIRDLVGGNEIDLGFTEIEINDANVQYKMPVCADIELSNNISCGVCVPCEKDADCAPIDIDPLVSQLFASDPLAQIAAALLFDLLWGSQKNHHLNFFCAPVAAGYGVCAPCANPLSACGSGSGGSGNTSTTCAHDVCVEGGPLGPSCDSCAATVCDEDPYCCDTEWDDICVSEAVSFCGACGSGTCAHSECSIGAKLEPSCSSCAGAICAADPYCCDTEWDSVCVNAVASTCGASTCGGGGGGGGNTCSHSECSAGGKLTDGCSPCATAVCDEDDYCCTTEWDALCVDIAETKSACSC